MTVRNFGYGHHTRVLRALSRFDITVQQCAAIAPISLKRHAWCSILGV